MKQTYLLLGMTIQAFVAGALSVFDIITINTGQQIWAGVLFLFLAFLLKPKKKAEAI